MVRDWVAGRFSFALAWGVPLCALAATTFIPEPIIQTAIGATSLGWMGVACLLNARRCSRTHCYFTGPFFLVMAVVALTHGLDVLSLGQNGGGWLAVIAGVGSLAIWVASERLLG